VLDFTSALYLGLEHGSGSLPSFSQLTTGVPAALREPPAAAALGARAAALVGCEDAILFPSTLHLFGDVFADLDARRCAILWDCGSYPIAGWGIALAAGRGVPSVSFRHLDPESLVTAMAGTAPGLRPVIVSDGFCAGCGRHAPLAAYAELAAARGGLLIVDDTQALGVFGRDARASAPFGCGGGGSVARSGLQRHPDILVGASMSKAFGAPLAFLAGARRRIRWIAERAPTRVHCSPPSAAAIAAATSALDINERSGDRLRARLALRIAELDAGLAAAGLFAPGSRAPMRCLAARLEGRQLRELHEALERRGVRTLLQHSRCMARASISLLLTARHRRAEIESAVAAIESAVASVTRAALRRRSEAIITWGEVR
jgi:8-amino-7-oxononanoate synthase